MLAELPLDRVGLAHLVNGKVETGEFDLCRLRQSGQLFEGICVLVLTVKVLGLAVAVLVVCSHLVLLSDRWVGLPARNAVGKGGRVARGVVLGRPVSGVALLLGQVGDDIGSEG